MAEQPQTPNNENSKHLDDTVRRKWKIGSQVEIFSDSKQKWLKGKIVKIMNDEEGEWLIVKYAGFSLKEIQRLNKLIRPIIKKNKQKKMQKRKTTNTKINDENTDINYTQNITKYHNESKPMHSDNDDEKIQLIEIKERPIWSEKWSDGSGEFKQHLKNKKKKAHSKKQNKISEQFSYTYLLNRLFSQLRQKNQHVASNLFSDMDLIQIPEMFSFDVGNVSDIVSMDPLMKRMDNLVGLVENISEMKVDQIVPCSVVDKVDFFCSSLHESLMEEPDFEEVISVPKFKFVCDCGAKFVGDIASKITSKNVICSGCNVECASYEWIWSCSNTNYTHSDFYCLCVKCGDAKMQIDENMTEMKNEIGQVISSQYICDCGGVFIASKTSKCFGCDRFLDSTIMHCNLCGNSYGYSTSMESMDILCGECARNQMVLNDISEQPFEQKFTLSTDTVEEFGVNNFQTDSSRNLQVGYNWSNKYKSDGINNSGTGNGFDNVGFIVNNHEQNELEVMMKLSYLQARISELFKVKLEITSVFELKDHNDFKRQTKKEQATIMEIIDMLKDMKNMSPQYYQQYSRQNKWAQHLLDTFDNVLFDKPYDAFNE